MLSISCLLFCLVTNYNQEYGTFWQITDMHIQAPKGKIEDSSTHFQLIKSALKFMKNTNPNPDFIAWTGDTISHSACEPGSPGPLAIINWASTQIKRHFPTTPVIPGLGNHDFCPANEWPIDDPVFYRKFLDKSGWSHFISPRGQAEFLKGGYYSQSISPRLEVIVLNSVHWIFPNKKSNFRQDPADQFEWLRQKLVNIVRNGKHVIILSHVPPGHEPNVTRKYNIPRFNQKFNKLLGLYENSIVGVLSGHLHHDAIFADPQVYKRAIYASPSLSRLTGNPGVRLYQFNRRTGEIKNYQQYYLTRTGGWIMHSQKSIYSIFGNNAQKLNEAVKKDICTYIELFSYSDTNESPCDNECIRSIYCSMQSLSPEKYNACMSIYIRFLDGLHC